MTTGAGALAAGRRSVAVTTGFLRLLCDGALTHRQAVAVCLHEAGHHVTGGARYGLIVCWLTWPWQAIYRSVLETSARLLRLLSLLQTHRDWPGKDLSERLEVTPRTVRRDVERLRLLGYPVQARPGAGGGTGWARARCSRHSCWATTKRSR